MSANQESDAHHFTRTPQRRTPSAKAVGKILADQSSLPFAKRKVSPNMPHLKARTLAREYVQRYKRPPDDIFPLLCAVREADWIPQWEYELVHSVSGFNELGCIFRTRKPYGTETVWVTTRWDTSNHEVNFVEFAVETMVVNLNITLKPESDGTTSARWEQQFFSLSKKGDEFIESYSQDKFEKVMKGLECAMNHYLETGKLLGSA